MPAKKLAAPHTTAAAKVTRNPDDPELTALLGSRQTATIFDKTVAHDLLAGLKNRAVEADRAAAVTVHLDGRDLIALYLHHGDAALGYETFAAMLKERWPLSIKTAINRMRIARYATLDQMRRYRFEKCKLGVRIALEKRLTSLADLEAKDIALPQGYGPRNIRFSDATCEQLEAALRLLKAPDAEVVPVAAGTALTQTRAWLREQREKSDEVEALDPIAFIRDGKVHLRVTADPTLAAAAAKLYARFAKRT